MNEPLWWQTGVIYQIYPRSFADANGDGIGDLQGIISHLDYLSHILGVDAIWLSPFYPSPMADFGYDVADYTDVDPIFGDLQTFDQLVAEAHAHDLRVIIDLVPNHTSDQHPWFKESRSSRQNPKRDWYVWVDPRPDGSPPNNWLSVFGGPAWEIDPQTGQYYLHSFLKEQPDLNWRNPDVKAAMFDVARFWLERGVDGFRIDVAHHIMKDPQLRDNPLSEALGTQIHKPLGDYDSQLHLYDKGHEDVHQVYRDLRELLDAYSQERPRMSVGEIHIFDWDIWVQYYGAQLDELHMPFNFTLLGAKWTAEDVRRLVEELEGALPPGAWPNYVLGNHDEPRLASRIGLKEARLAAMLLLTLRGTPTLYYGDEIGMTDVPIPPEAVQDPWGIRVPGLGRDPARTPMQWNDGQHAGFSPPDADDPWLPLAENYKRVNVERQLSQSNSMLNLYRQLLRYRKETPSLHRGSYQALDVSIPDLFVFKRHAEGYPAVLILLNFSEENREIDLSNFGKGTIRITTALDSKTEFRANLNLRPFEGVLVELES